MRDNINNFINETVEIKAASPVSCIKSCLTKQLKFIVFIESVKMCLCIRNLANLKGLSNKCDYADSVNIYNTGQVNLTKPNGAYERKSRFNVNLEFQELKNSNKLPRIVFLFSVNGRSIRQILRLVKAIYSDQHYYYFHIDEV